MDIRPLEFLNIRKTDINISKLLYSLALKTPQNFEGFCGSCQST